MTRNIVCADCNKHYMPMHPEDVAAGWQRRFVDLTIAGHLSCDWCNRRLEPGAPTVAVTMWRDNIEPYTWETAYGSIGSSTDDKSVDTATRR